MILVEKKKTGFD